MKSSILLGLVTLVLTFGGAFSAEIEWTRYTNSTFGYSVDVPSGLFRSSSNEDKGVTLLEQEGRGQIDIYGATNVQMLTPRQFEQALAGADRIREITYSRRGESWFVISGYYRRQGDESDDLIFYAKFLFSQDRSALSAFEASYAAVDKRRYDPIIERMEKSLTAPRGDTR
jgi:hypothetical protein